MCRYFLPHDWSDWSPVDFRDGNAIQWRKCWRCGCYRMRDVKP